MARERTRDRVHAAALALAQEGADGPAAARLTMEGIAKRAGASKQTLYRSWPSPGAILFDALLAETTDDRGAVAIPSTGDLASDLADLATGMARELSDPARGPLLRALTAEILADAGLAAQYRERLLAPQIAAIADRLRKGGAQDPEAAAELLVGPIFHRWLLGTGPLDDAWIAAHLAGVLRALA